MRALVRLLLRVFLRPRMMGSLDHFGSPRLLVVASHPSRLDALLLWACLPRDSVFVLTKEEIARGFGRRILAKLPHVLWGDASPQEVRKLLRILASGKPLVMFPEGRVTGGGSLAKIHELPAWVAEKAQASLLPVYLDGPQWSRLSGTPEGRRWFVRATISVGRPFLLPSSREGSRKERRRAQAAELRRALCAVAAQAAPRRSLFDALLDAVAVHGRNTRVIEEVGGPAKSYGKLVKASLALGKWVSRFSSEKEVVGVLLPNLSATVAALFGLWASGRAAALLNYTAGAAAVADACAAARVRIVVTSRRFLEAAKLESVTRCLEGVTLVYLEEVPRQFTLLNRLWLIAYAQWFPRSALRLVSPEDTAVVLFTSGSGGRAKGVALSHRAILANVAQISAVIDFSPRDKFLNALPLYHAYSFTCCTVMPLLKGTPVFLYPTPLHYRVIPEVAYRHGCTCLFGTSTFLKGYGEAAHPLAFQRVRYVISGGEKLDEEVRRLWLEKFGLRILEGYGTTECAPVIALSTPAAYKAGTVGEFLPGIEYQLVKLSGLARGGVLQVKGPNLMLGYLLPEAPGVIQFPRSEAGPGWYDTGDVVEVDKEGLVTVLGRVRRFAKVAGEMVSLDLVERIASRASPGNRHAAILAADREAGERVVLFTTDRGLTRAALARAAQALGAPALAVPKSIVHVRELPLLASGKTDYLALFPGCRGEGAFSEPAVILEAAVKPQRDAEARGN